MHLRDALGLEPPAVAIASCEQHRHPLAPQTARNEDQGIGGGRVQPVRVIDHAHKRLVVGRRGDQLERSGGHKEPVRISRRGQPERTLQRRRLNPRQLTSKPENRPQQTEQPGKRQIALGLHPRDLKHGHRGRRTQREFKQRALANARLAP